MEIINIEVDMTTNPTNATITVNPPDNVAQFRLKYLYAGSPVAEIVVNANYVTNADFVQPLAELNALVPAQNNNADLTLVAIAKNAGGESGQKACAETIQIVNTPSTPSSVVVS